MLLRPVGIPCPASEPGNHDASEVVLLTVFSAAGYTLRISAAGTRSSQAIWESKWFYGNLTLIKCYVYFLLGVTPKVGVSDNRFELNITVSLLSSTECMQSACHGSSSSLKAFNDAVYNSIRTCYPPNA